MMVAQCWQSDTGNNKATLVMKTDLYCSKLHQVWPHCAPIRASSHYSSLSCWFWWQKKARKSPNLYKKEGNQFHLLDPMADCSASFWCSMHTHTHTQPIWHLFSSPLLALHCPCHMANEKDQKACVCVCVFANECVWGRWGGGTGGLLESDLLTKTPYSIRDLHEYMGTSQAE